MSLFNKKNYFPRFTYNRIYYLQLKYKKYKESLRAFFLRQILINLNTKKVIVKIKQIKIYDPKLYSKIYIIN